MSISASLHKAAKLQEKIEGLRKQLSDLLNKTRQELAAAPAPEIPAVLRRTSARGSQATKPTKAGKGTKAPARRGRGARAAKEVAAAVEAPAVRRGRKGAGKGRSPLASRKRASSPGGPLAPAVVKVLQDNGQPMRVAEILEGLSNNGYVFSSPEPKKNLAARIYRLSGVKQVAQGLFAQA